MFILMVLVVTIIISLDVLFLLIWIGLIIIVEVFLMNQVVLHNNAGLNPSVLVHGLSSLCRLLPLKHDACIGSMTS